MNTSSGPPTHGNLLRVNDLSPPISKVFLENLREVVLGLRNRQSQLEFHLSEGLHLRRELYCELPNGRDIRDPHGKPCILAKSLLRPMSQLLVQPLGKIPPHLLT